MGKIDYLSASLDWFLCSRKISLPPFYLVVEHYLAFSFLYDFFLFFWRLQNQLDQLAKQTKELFNRLFISAPQRRLSRYGNQLRVILNVRDIAKRRFSHFNSYLNVRGQRNVTMTAYHNDFPALVHFVYINRCVSLNCLIALVNGLGKKQAKDLKNIKKLQH